MSEFSHKDRIMRPVLSLEILYTAKEDMGKHKKYQCQTAIEIFSWSYKYLACMIRKDSNDLIFLFLPF